MNSEQIRNKAYSEIAENLPFGQRRVFTAVLTLAEATNQQISDHLDIPINQVTGRVRELTEMFMLQQVGERKGAQTGYTHAVWGPVQNETQRQELISKELESLEKRASRYLDDMELLTSSLKISTETRDLIECELRKINRRISKIKSLVS